MWLLILKDCLSGVRSDIVQRQEVGTVEKSSAVSKNIQHDEHLAIKMHSYMEIYYGVCTVHMILLACFPRGSVFRNKEQEIRYWLD